MKTTRRVTFLLQACGAIFIWITLGGIAAGLNVEIASSPNPVGSGARAMGMGGAFISIADDATAASWNPGGLIQLEKPELSLVYSYYSRTEDYASSPASRTVTRTESPPLTVVSTKDVATEVDTGTITPNGINYMSAALPFTVWDRNVVISLNYQHLYDFNKDVTHTFRTDQVDVNRFYQEIPNPPFPPIVIDTTTTVTRRTTETHEFEQTGGLYTISPAISGQITPTLSLGATFNIWENILGHNGWTARHDITSVESEVGGEKYRTVQQDKTTYRFSGYNMNFGFLWDATEIITIGGVFKTPFTAKVRQTLSSHSIRTRITDPANPVVETSSFPDPTKEDLDLKMPTSYGLGVALRFSDVFTMALDIFRTEWDEYLFVSSDGTEISPITRKDPDEERVRATHQVRIGAEYLFIRPSTVIPLRGGIFYDPEPRGGAPQDYYGFSLGSGFMWKNLVMDVAYQYRWGNDVSGEVIGSTDAIKADIQQHYVLASAIWHF